MTDERLRELARRTIATAWEVVEVQPLPDDAQQIDQAWLFRAGGVIHSITYEMRWCWPSAASAMRLRGRRQS